MFLISYRSSVSFSEYRGNDFSGFLGLKYVSNVGTCGVYMVVFMPKMFDTFL